MNASDALRTALLIGIASSSLAGCSAVERRGDPYEQVLPSWREGDTRTAIIDFVQRTCRIESPEFVPPADRIAVFDNDGTLWSEQPMYAQLAFAMDRIRSEAGSHPEWTTTSPFSFVLENDMEGLASTGMEGIVELVVATHAGTDTEEFQATVVEWLDSARHPVTERRYDEMAYQPMLELLGFLRAHDFETWIVSGGGIDFMRVFTEDLYGIPPRQVVGSLGDLEFVSDDAGPRLERTAGITFVDDKGGKPVGIWRAIGRRPILAVGNSDGDFEMLEWTTAGDGARLGIYLHHTDAEREVAYDRVSSFGRLDRGLDEATDRGWVVIDMAADWKRVFPAID